MSFQIALGFILKRGGQHCHRPSISVFGLIAAAAVYLPSKPDPSPSDPHSEPDPFQAAAITLPAVHKYTFPLPIPTRALPDLAKLPKGKVHVWGTILKDTRGRSVGDWKEVDDFVEVQITGDSWAGLRANGDVLAWTPSVSDPGATTTYFNNNISTLSRSSDHQYGIFGIRESGEVVTWGTPPDEWEGDVEWGSGTKFAKITSSAFRIIFLTTDGKIYCNSIKPPHIESGQFVDVTCDQVIFAARKSDGYWIAWGDEKCRKTMDKIESLGPDVISLSIYRDQIAWIE